MSMKPTRYEYAPPVQIAGVAKDFTSKIEISQTPAGQWSVELRIVSGGLDTAAAATTKLREEMLRLIEHLGTSK
jgi:hypothetical protein